MTYLDSDRVRPVARERDARAAEGPDSRVGRRRAVCMTASIATIVVALVLPPSARAAWPLESAAPVALSFGSTYAGSDGTQSTHRGVDLGAAEGSSVRSPLSGRVSFVGRVPGTGGGTTLVVTVASASGSLTLLPLASARVVAGTELAEGDVIGVLAGTGDASSSGSHLHVGVRKGDLYLDPLSLFAVPVTPRVHAPEPRQASPVVPGERAGVSGEKATAPRGQSAAHAAAASLSSVSAAQVAGSVVPGARTVSAGAVAAAAPAVAAVPGARVAPGVSVAEAFEGSAQSGTTMQALSAVVSEVAGGTSRSRSGERPLTGAFIDWALGMAARALEAGLRLLAGVLLALGALWPIWRRERRKGMDQLSVRPVRDDVAAVAGR